MNYRVNEAYYKMARRAYRKLCVVHHDAIENEMAGLEADAVIAGHCGDPLPVDDEPLFGVTSCSMQDRLLLSVADDFGINPTLLDDMLIAADYAEQDRYFAHKVVGRARGPSRAAYDDLQRLAALGGVA